MTIDDDPGRLPIATTGGRWRRNVVPAALAVILSALVALALPAAWVARAPVYPIGAVADDDVIAPFTLRVPKSADELARDRAEAARLIEPVVERSPALADSVEVRLDRFLGALDSTAAAGVRDGGLPAAMTAAAARQDIRLSISEATYLSLQGQRASMIAAVRRVFDRTLRDGVAARATADGFSGFVRIVGERGEERVPAAALQTFDDVLARARRAHPDPASPAGDALYLRLLRLFFRPTLVVDSVETETRRAIARAGVDVNRLSIRQGERIVRAHDIVDAPTHAKLVELREAQRRRGSGASMVGRWIGTALAALLVFGLVGWLVRLQRPDLYQAHRALAVLALALGIVVIA
ncbi:MAG: hypothetical protein MUE41_18430, partial [Gemmatimonadaceae bacterium]|nr:hypothetical protein [Gemmatimonadaceae bacterium]